MYYMSHKITGSGIGLDVADVKKDIKENDSNNSNFKTIMPMR